MRLNYLSYAAVILLLMSPGMAVAKGHGARAKAKAAAAAPTVAGATSTNAGRTNYNQTVRTENGITTIDANYTNKRGNNVHDTATIAQSSNGNISRDILVQKPNGNVVREQEILTPNQNGTYNVSGTATKNYGNVHQYYNVMPISEKNVALSNPTGSLNDNVSASNVVNNNRVGISQSNNPAGVTAVGRSYGAVTSSSNNVVTNVRSNSSYSTNVPSGNYQNNPSQTVYGQTLTNQGTSEPVYNTGG